jgi:hypothetical protein
MVWVALPSYGTEANEINSVTPRLYRADMPDLQRRARPTVRCLVDDLRLQLPGLAVDLGEIDHPLLSELRRVAATSPLGQKRILSIASVMVYRIRVSSYRGATWVDTTEPTATRDTEVIVWLCASHRRDDGSVADAYEHFGRLHGADRELERYLEPALFETRTDWPSGEIGWFEVVRLGLR